MSESVDSDVNWWGLLTDPDYLADPHPHLHRLRAMAPVQRDDWSGIFFVLGHDAFNAMVRAPQMGRDTRLWTNGWARPGGQEEDPLSHALFSEFQPQMVNSNPPDHRRMRDVYEKAFIPAAIRRLEDPIRAECRTLLEAFPADGSPVDFMTAFANHLPARVSRMLFEIPQDMDAQIADWNRALIRIGDIMMTPAQKGETLDALRAYKAYLRDHLATRRSNPGDGWLALALKAEADGRLSEEETLCNLLGLVTGNETTVNLLGNGLLSLLRHPRQMAALRAEPTLMRSAIEEMLRFEPSLNFILRVAISDYQCGDVTMPAGSLAIGLIGAVNRDPARFADPDVFDIARKPNPQVIFGGGPHVCIGAALARMQGEIALGSLLERHPEIALAGEPAWWTDRTNQRGLERLPICVTPSG